ncbi:hypothetical protein ASZ78_005614 [Callipepla squamata]|uniref:Rab-GAP TBC domain-containing protein n=1 Tax=Callipepla squamata TaxID=9009 RepID=A0A226NJS8_CALSU|nr:hypothetical protein ASZ78_005614 [Callipepla squamata]
MLILWIFFFLLQVPEIISSIRQAGKIARQEEFQSNLSDIEDPFAKKFEVLFCGRVTVAHKNAPPALIDECIEKFNRASCTKNSDSDSSSQEHETANNSGGFSFSNKFRSVFQPLIGEEEEKRPIRKSFSQPGLRSLAFKKDFQEGGHRSNSFVRSFEEDAISLNLKSQLIYGHSVVQPTDIAENRTMLFTIGQSEVYLISPDTKKVAIEKSFKEISFCSQGIRHVDHFGFICRESSENGGFHFVCYVFQCADEALVDEIMMTLKQAFTVAAVQQTSKAQPQLCETCPLQSLHKLCEKIEGLHPSKTKLELQKHLTTLNSQEQASVFEEVKKLRPRNDQKENELIISILRNMYEEKQKDHVHIGEAKQASQPSAENAVNEVPSSAPRFRLDMLKNKAKRSLTESFESILSRGSKARGPLDSSGGSVDLEASVSSTLSSTNKEPPLSERETDRVPTLPTENAVKTSGSVGDLSSDPDSYPIDHSVLPQQSFRRRANTLSHLPSESRESLVPVETSPSVPQRKLMRYHSVSTETPHKRKLSRIREDNFTFVFSSLFLLSYCVLFFLLLNSIPLVGIPLYGLNTSVGEPKSSSGQLARSPTLARLNPSASSPNFLKYLRHNSSGEQSGHFAQKSLCYFYSVDLYFLVLNYTFPNCTLSISYRTALRKKLHSSSSVPNFLKFLAPVDENNTSDFRSTTSDYESKHSQEAVGADSPVRTRRHSWRQQIFLRVATPQKACDSPSRYDASENNLQNRRLKLDYEEITPCLKEVTLIWEKMLSTPGRSKIKFDVEKIHSAVGQGRTFPTHPYFSAQLGAGQLSLYNILKAYSLLDQEVGYCQGLSFVAGVLLLHMSEEDAFKMLKFLMFDVGLRKQYRPDMTILQIQMYQLSRLLHDYHRDLYNHLEEHEIGPSLYAAPWFLTMFASQFPLGFVARVFDMLFLQGSEAIFKVALSLLGSHKPLILQHENLETIVDFIKNTLPNLGLVQMEKTISQVFEMDIAKQLQAYEVEYHVLQDELIDSSLNDNQRLDKLEKANSSLRKQNFELLEELQVANGKIQNLEATVELLLTNEGKLKESILTLEQERAALQKAVEEMRKKIGDTNEKPMLTRQAHLDAD